MKDFGVWYFEYGYLIMPVLAFCAGGMCKNPRHLFGVIAFLMSFGLFAGYCKYYL